MITNAPPTSNFPNVFYEPMSAPNTVGDIQADILGLVGETTRGPVNQAIYVDSPTDFKNTFGGMTPNALNPLVPLSGYPDFLSVCNEQVQDKIFVRVCNSLATTGYVTISNGTGAMFTLHAYSGPFASYSPGSWVSGLSVSVQPGATAGVFNLTVSNAATGEVDQITGLDYTNNANMIKAINASAKMVYATQPVIDGPSAAPTLTATPGGGNTVLANTYFFVVTYILANGQETNAGPEMSVVLTATGSITISTTPQTGTVGIKVYGGTASGAEVFWGQNTAGYSVTQTAPPAASTVQPPLFNGALKGAGDQSALPLTGVTAFPTARGVAGTCPGIDGAGATTAQYIGNAGSPNTGLNALTGLSPAPNFTVLCGAAGGDSTGWAACATLAANNGWIHVATFPQGTTDTAAKAAIVAATPGMGTAAQYIKWAFPWIGYQDNEYYNALIKVSPAAKHAAITAVTPANTSAGNKPLSNMSGPEYSYSYAQMESLIGDNINVVTGLIPSDGVGMSTDLMGSGDDGFLIRMRLLLAANFQKLGGQFVQLPNSPANRQQAHDLFTAFLDDLARQDLIPANPSGATTGAPPATTGGSAKGSQPSAGAVTTQGLNYLVICDDTNNLFNGVATKTMYVDVWVRLYDNVKYLLFRAAVGTNVQISSVISS